MRSQASPRASGLPARRAVPRHDSPADYTYGPDGIVTDSGSKPFGALWLSLIGRDRVRTKTTAE